MAKNSSSAVLLILVVVLVVSTAVRGYGGMVGGRTKVKDVKSNEEVQELGRYSVEQYNLQQKKSHLNGGRADLRFQAVVEAEKQVVSGIKYYLKITAVYSRSEIPRTFEAVVVVQPWAHSKELLNFSPSPATK
ncbi:hypothetical protein ACSBR2_030418 [Camellia fascicularis]